MAIKVEQHGVEYDFHDYKVAGIGAAQLQRWSAGTTFRKLPDSQKSDLDKDKALALMAAQPSIIKRPVVEVGRRLVVGFKPELYRTINWA